MPALRGPFFFAVRDGKIVDESRDPALRSVLAADPFEWPLASQLDAGGK
jgi:hypothetical protein